MRRKFITRVLICTLLLLPVSTMALAENNGLLGSVSSTFRTIISKAFGVSVEKNTDAVNLDQPQFVDLDEQQVLTLTKEGGEVQAYRTAVARSNADMANGLMWRKEMPENVGMIFVFRDNAPRSFWMKNTYIPLDMLFMDSNGKVLHIYEGAKPLDKTQIRSSGPAKMVLELNAGQVAEHGYKIGDVVGGAGRLSN